jgi:hypothetical protein
VPIARKLEGRSGIGGARLGSARQLAKLHERIAELPHGESRVTGALDFIFEMYSGTFFAAILELSLAARGDPELKADGDRDDPRARGAAPAAALQRDDRAPVALRPR